jgi:hypothetical protein
MEMRDSSIGTFMSFRVRNMQPRITLRRLRRRCRPAQALENHLLSNTWKVRVLRAVSGRQELQHDGACLALRQPERLGVLAKDSMNDASFHVPFDVVNCNRQIFRWQAVDP